MVWEWRVRVGVLGDGTPEVGPITLGVNLIQLCFRTSLTGSISFAASICGERVLRDRVLRVWDLMRESSSAKEEVSRVGRKWRLGHSGCLHNRSASLRQRKSTSGGSWDLIPDLIPGLVWIFSPASEKANYHRTPFCPAIKNADLGHCSF